MDLVAWSAYESQHRLKPLGSRWAHTLGVVARAQMLAPAVASSDWEVLIAAAYVHDIGYSPGLKATGFHPLDGAYWLRAHGFERLAGLVAHHSGARFEADVRGLGDELDEFPEELSATADALTYCDLTTDADGREVTPPVRLAGIEHRYGADSEVSRGIKAASTVFARVIARTERRVERCTLIV